MLQVLATWDDIDRLEEDWERAVIGFSDKVSGAVQAAVTEGADEARQTHRYRDQTGLLTSMTRGMVEISVPGGAIGSIVAATSYASYVDGGTQPHEIRGNPYLTFKGSGGNWVTVQSVQHPGTQPDGFMQRAASKAEIVLIREIEVGIDELQNFLT